MTTLGSFEQLAFRLLGYEPGAWFWLANSQSVDQRSQLRWDQKQGMHPFVLISPYTGGPTAILRPRSAHVERGIHHAAHPPDCAPTCHIRLEGWIQSVKRTLKADLLTRDNYSCFEPYADILATLREGIP